LALPFEILLLFHRRRGQRRDTTNMQNQTTNGEYVVCSLDGWLPVRTY
jgi:hypothetical protein